MSIGGSTGPKGPGGPKLPRDEAKLKSGPKDVAGADFNAVLGTTEPREITGVVPSALSEIASQVKSGEITATEAAARIVDAVVARRGAALQPAAQAQLRQSLHRALTDDPTLAAVMKELVL